MFVDKLFVEFYVESLNINLQKKNTEQTNIVSEPLTFFQTLNTEIKNKHIFIVNYNYYHILLHISHTFHPYFQ